MTAARAAANVSGSSPVRPCPSLRRGVSAFASGAPPETGVRLATPRDRDAAGNDDARGRRVQHGNHISSL